MASKNADRLNMVISKMMSCDFTVVSDATDELRRIKIDEASGLQLLEAAANTPDCSELMFGHPSAYLVEAAAKFVSPKYNAIILRDYPKYKQGGKSEAVRILLKAGTSEAYETLQALMQKSCERGDFELTPGMASSLSDNKDSTDLPFVECLVADLRFGRPVNYEVALVVLGHLQQGWISDEKQEPLGPHLVRRITELLKIAKPMQQTSGEGWKWEDNYLKVREELGLLLDIYSSTTLKLDEKLLREVLTLTDARLKLFASNALLSINSEVPLEVMLILGRDAEIRNELFDRLRKLGLGSMFPNEFNNQLSLAEGDLVRWLTYPSELGRVPDKIKFLEIKSDKDGTQMYFFAFMTEQPHWSADDGWMLGWAGPFPKNGELSSQGSNTFSEFESLK